MNSNLNLTNPQGSTPPYTLPSLDKSSKTWRDTILENAPDALIGVHKLSGEIIEWNHQAELLFGWTKASALNQDFIKLLNPQISQGQKSSTPNEGFQKNIWSAGIPTENSSENLLIATWDEFFRFVDKKKHLVQAPIMYFLSRHQRWLDVQIFLVPAPDELLLSDNIYFFVRDISEIQKIKNEKMALLEREQSAKREAQVAHQRVYIQYMIMKILSEAATVDEAMPFLLGEIAKSMGWSAGTYWQVNEANDLLEPKCIWTKPQILKEEFEKITLSQSFSKSENMLGRVWRSGRAGWIRDTTQEVRLNTVRNSLGSEIKGGFWVPLSIGSQVFGVLEFLSQNDEFPDDLLLRAMEVMGAQIGHFCERIRNHENLKIQSQIKERSEQRFRTFFEQSPVPLMIFGMDGEALQANKAWAELFGVTLKDLQGYNVLKDKQIERLGFSKNIQEAFNGNIVQVPPFLYDPALSGKPGRARWLEVFIYPVKSSDGKTQEVALLEQDVTDQIHAIKTLREREEHFRLLADTTSALSESLDYQETLKRLASLIVPRIADWCSIEMPDATGKLVPIVITHADPKKNEWALEITKKYPTEMDAQNGAGQVFRTGVSEIIPELSQEMLTAAAKDADQLKVINELQLKSYICVPLRARGKILGVVSIFTTHESKRSLETAELRLAEDLGERAALAIDNALLYQEAASVNRVKDEFLATLSHELRTPLNVIQGHADLLRAEALQMNHTEIINSAEAIFRNAYAQTQITSDLLDVSKIITGKMSFLPELVSPAEIALSVIENIQATAESKGLTLTHDVIHAPKKITADATRLQQILWNVLSNAIKFTPEGGSVEVTVSEFEGSCCFEIIDTGRGIEPNFLPYVFDRFRQEDSSTTRTFGGLGLGLAIVRHLAEIHGGHVEAESRGKGKGSRFKIFLPIFRAYSFDTPLKTGVEKPTDVGPSEKMRLDGKKILLVEDSVDSRKLVSMLLIRYGASVLEAESAEEARKILKNTHPDIIVSDIGMPDEDGLEFIRNLRNSEEVGKTEPIPAIALTAYVRPEEREQSIEAGFQSHVSKPVSKQILIQEILRLVAKKS